MGEPRKFFIEPLKEHCINVKKKNDQYYAHALSNDITREFLDYIKFSIDRNELVNLNCGGRVRCLDGNTEIYVKSGTGKISKKLKDVSIRDYVLSMNPTTYKTEWKQVTNKLYYENQEVYKIKTLHNRTIVANNTHKFYTLLRNRTTCKLKQQTITTKQLTKNHYIPLLANLEREQQTNELEFRKGYILGCYLADGNINYNGIYLTNNDQEIINYYKESLTKLYGVECKQKQKANCNSYKIWFVSRHFNHEYKKQMGKGSGNKHISESLLNQTKSFKKGLLNGYFSCEATIGLSKTKDHYKTNFTVTSKSKQLVMDVSRLLLDFGIISHIRKRILKSGRYKGNTYYRLTISTLNLFKFVKEIGFISTTRKEQLEKIYNYYNEKPPEEQRIYWHNYFLDRFDRIKKLPNKQKVYSIEVKDNHNFFLTNGMLSMNSGKSLAMICLCKIISDYTGVPFTVERNIIFNESQFLNIIEDANFHEIFLVDETEVGHTGAGAMAEQWSSKDFRRICAKKCIHNVNLCGDFSQLNTNAFYKLVTLSRDLKNKLTKLLVSNVEDNENIPIGTITIPLEPILCDDMKTGKVIGCIKCPKYEQGCKELIAEYERKKDGNIEKISGGKPEERAMIRFEVAQELVQNEEYMKATNQKQRKILVRRLAPEISNRRFTEGEMDEVVEITRMIIEQAKSQEAMAEEEEVEPEPVKEKKPKKKKAKKVVEEEPVVMEKEGNEGVGMSKQPTPKIPDEEEEVYPDHETMLEELRKLNEEKKGNLG